ncbi:MAG: hypothetical protein QOF89_2074 [Acidobacteriota bacterium]|nr:hypothetical protein [Acidobacteriota bacterium]
MPIQPRSVGIVPSKNGFLSDERAEYRAKLRDRAIPGNTFPQFRKRAQKLVDRARYLISREQLISLSLRKMELGHSDKVRLAFLIYHLSHPKVSGNEHTDAGKRLNGSMASSLLRASVDVRRSSPSMYM